MRAYDRARLHRALDAVMDASQYEVKQGRSGNWAVFKAGEDFPESAWFSSKAKAQESLRKLSGVSTKVAAKAHREKEEPDVMGYPWETIQAAQRGLISGSQMGAHAQGVRKKRGF